MRFAGRDSIYCGLSQHRSRVPAPTLHADAGPEFAIIREIRVRDPRLGSSGLSEKRNVQLKPG